MAKASNRRRKGRHRGASARANADLSAHLTSLGLESVSAYRAWCRERGLSGALNKSWQERRQERSMAQQQLDGTREEAEIDLHVKRLGLDGRDAYQAWCNEHGQGDALRKKRVTTEERAGFG